MSLSIKVTPTENGAVIAVNGFDISITVSTSEAGGKTPGENVIAVSVDRVKSRLDEFLEDLTVTQEEDEIIVRPTGYLGRERFASIAAIVRELGGSYVSAGKESRFVIPKD